MAGVMSMPVACAATLAKAQTTSPPPHATSSTVSVGPAPEASMSKLSAISSLIPGEVLKGIAWRVNWSRIDAWCAVDIRPWPPSRRLLVDPSTLHDQAEVVGVLEDTQVAQRVAGDHDEVGILAALHGPDLDAHPEQLG